jgi:hypothetical protein
MNPEELEDLRQKFKFFLKTWEHKHFRLNSKKDADDIRDFVDSYINLFGKNDHKNTGNPFTVKKA